MSTTPAKPNKLIFAPGHPSQPTSNTNSTQDHPSDPPRAAQFRLSTLTLPNLDRNPITQFHTWYTDPVLADTVPETVTLSTASLPSGRVSSRIVYLKELSSAGDFVIYSNWATSRKAADLATNPYVALCFWWKATERQVRIEGRGERLSCEESQVYFDTRARGSRIGAWASQQSSILHPTGEGGDDDGRNELEEQVAEIERRFAGVDKIPVPEFWGGLKVKPDMMEFWQGRESRLHDRFRYTRVQHGLGDRVVEGEEEWKIERLSP